VIKISAIICTFRRPDYLRHALRSLCEQSLPRDEYEIIVVDNAVEAEAEQVVREFEDGRINLRYLPEENVGLSRARNTGLKAANGRYVAYMDDDARADTNWLEALVAAFEKVSPPPAAVGGRVWLDWHGEKPSWVPERHLSLFTYVDHGDDAHALASNEYLVGANIAFEKDALNAMGGFDPDLGRQGTTSGARQRCLLRTGRGSLAFSRSIAAAAQLAIATSVLGRRLAAPHGRTRALTTRYLFERLSGPAAVWPLVLGDFGFCIERQKRLSMGIAARAISACRSIAD